MNIALLMPDNLNWRGGARAGLYLDFLKSKGHNAEVIFLKRSGFPQNLIGFDIVFNHAMQAPPDKLRSFAIKNPMVSVVHVNHSAIGHLDQQETIKQASKQPKKKAALKEQGEMTRKLCDILYAAKSVSNIWYASIDYPHIAVSAGVKRCLHLPAPMPFLEPRKWRPPRSKPIVSIIGRDDPIKNRINQYIAVAGLKDKIEIHFVAEKTELIINTMKAMGADYKHIPTMKHQDWIKYISDVPDIVLQCSYAESFNNVTCESMQVGVPVVASNAIKNSDPIYWADPNDPESIRNTIIKALKEYKNACDRASKIGREVAEFCQNKYLEGIQNLRELGNVFYPRELPRINLNRSGSRCLAFVCGDSDSKETFDLAKPSIEKYAAKTNAEIVCIDEQPIKGYKIGNKWLCTQISKSFNKVLYLDCDVWINDAAPDLFDIVPQGKFAVYDELKNINKKEAMNRISRLASSLPDNPTIGDFAVNSGVMLFDHFVDFLYKQPELPVRNFHTLDQDFLSIQLAKNLDHWFPLDEKFNWIFFREDFWDGVKEAWFVHLAGARPHSYRCQLLKRFLADDFSPIMPPDYNKCSPAWAV